MLLYDFIPGASIGITKTLIGYPFETLKNRTQLNKKENIYIKDLYKGCSIPLFTSILKRSIQLYVYEKNNNKNTYIAGAYGGIISSIITNPLNIIKTNIQTKNYNNIKEQLNINILKRGNVINIFRDTLFTSYYLGTYGYSKKNLPNKSIYYSLSGIISGSTVWLLFCPFDYIRTIRYSGYNYKYIYTNIKQNPFIMWNGCKYMIFKSIPLNMINMVVYEYLKKNLK